MLIKPGIWFPWVPDPFEFSLLGSIPSIRRADGGFLKIADPDQTFDFLVSFCLENSGSHNSENLENRGFVDSENLEIHHNNYSENFENHQVNNSEIFIRPDAVQDSGYPCVVRSPRFWRDGWSLALARPL